ncbi:MAG: thiamine pyrophosphate-requiring protein [Chloroflexi bacterium]|nr:thiamine pyrophosphate-requiring protein [Chloroflexota bacterium]
MNVSEAIARILKQEGIEWAACFPSNPLIEPLAKEGVRVISFRHERGAGMAADGYSRLNDRKKFGVFLVQSQAGSENAMGAIAQMFADNIPVLVMPGAPGLDHISIRPEFWPSRSYERFAKQTETILKADQTAAVMRRAFHALRNGRPGPVVVDIPADVGNMDVPEAALAYKSPTTLHQVPTKGDIQDAVKAMIAAKRPVIWAGMGVLLAGASRELTELAELLEAPVFTSMPGKSAIDERHPLALGAGSGATTLAAVNWLRDSDLLFGAGTSLTLTGYGQRIPPGKFIIHNTLSQEDINKDQSVDIGLAGDARLTLAAMVEEVKAQLGPNGRKGKTTVPAEVAKVKAQWYEEWMPVLTDDTEPINPMRVIHEIDRALDKSRSIVTHDAGAPRDMMVPFYTAGAPHSYIGWGKTTHLGYGIPLMIGAKMAFPDKFCLNFMGDGAFGMSGLDIETSVRAGVPITTVVLNNGIMATYPGGFPTAKAKFGTTLMTGDYAKIAEGLGAVGITVTQPSEVAGAIRKAQQLNASGKTVLIDIHTNLEARRSNFR